LQVQEDFAGISCSHGRPDILRKTSTKGIDVKGRGSVLPCLPYGYRQYKGIQLACLHPHVHIIVQFFLFQLLLYAHFFVKPFDGGVITRILDALHKSLVFCMFFSHAA
jgi:hypothetical protein